VTASNPEAVHAALRAFFAQLVASGVRHVALSPGSRSTPLTVAADQTPDLEVSVHLDERSGGFFALGLARATRRPVALICTSGTAAANYLPAVVEAFHSGVPLLVLTADRPPELQGRGAPQTIDQVELFGTHVRWFHQPAVAGTEDPGEAVALAAAAVQLATQETPGPVHLNWPLREPLEPPTDEPPMAELLTNPLAEIRPCPPLPNCPRGLLVVGPLDLNEKEKSVIADLANASGWPIIADPASSLRHGPHTVNSLVLSTGEHIFRSSWADKHGPEVIVQLGGLPTSKAYRLWLERTRPPQVITVDHLRRHPDPVNVVTQRINLAPADWAARAAVTHRPDPSWALSWQQAEQQASAAVASAMADAPFSNPAVVEVLGALLPSGAALVVGNSMPIRDLDAFLPVGQRPLGVYANRGANGIDGQVSTALGVGYASGGPTVFYTGDLTLLHDLSGWAAARRLGVDITVVVVDNNGGGIFSFLPIAKQNHVDHRRLFHTPHDLDLAHLAPLVGANYHRVSHHHGLEEALAMSLGHPGLHLIHVLVEATDNIDLHRKASAAAVEALDR
jgi:2-succinyl-5-enolpyruvyl-6-hydroxy-3-cyclohexene-1-carboxylate synthase